MAGCHDQRHSIIIINSDSFTKTDITEYENLQEKQRQ